MSTAEVVTLPSSLARTADRIGQATAVEQARAVAEVQAAIIVAQQCPRDMDRALGDMRDSTGRMSLASRAFYSVPNRGNGPSVHLARELARIWGNVQYGVHELRQDIEHGSSEVQAFAWDVQTNTRSTRTFIVQHARMKGGKQQKLTDLGDIYLSNQNVGARAVRECIFSVLPPWMTEEAQDRCRATLEKGEGKPLEQRRADAVALFEKLGIKVAQLEEKLGHKRGTWMAGDVAQLGIAYTSITRDGIDKDELFPPAQRVTAAEIIGNQQAPATTSPAAGTPEPAADQPTDHTLTTKELGTLQGLFKAKGFHDSADRHSYIEQTLDLETDTLTSTGDLTSRQAQIVTAALRTLGAS